MTTFVDLVRYGLFFALGAVFIGRWYRVPERVAGLKERVTLGLVGGVFGVLIGSGLSIIAQSCILPIEYDEAQRVKIYSSAGAEGRFVLGTERVRGLQYYTYYQAAGSGMKRGRVPVNNTTVVEGEQQPELIIYERRYVDDSGSYIGGPILQSIGEDADFRRYEMIVPKGTVLSWFSVE